MAKRPQEKQKRKYKLDTLFRTIGEVTVTWAYLELVIDCCIITIHDKWDGAKFNPQIPRRQLARKIQYLRDWYAKHHCASMLFPNFDNVVDLLEQASEHRHRLIHGAVINFAKYEGSGVIETMRQLHQGEGIAQEHADYSRLAVRNFRNHAVGLATFLGMFTEILCHDPDNCLGSLFVEIGGLFPFPKRARNQRNKGRSP